MDDGSLAVVTPEGKAARSVVSSFSGADGTRLRLVPREASVSEDATTKNCDRWQATSRRYEAARGDRVEWYLG
jgi:hypothetical protein